MKKVGRNDQCPCGSGRKYKKCCLPRERAAGAGAGLLHDCLGRMTDWIFSNEMLADEFRSVADDFMRDSPLDEFGMALLSDAFIFDHKLPGKNMTPFEFFMENAQLSPDERSVYEGFSRNTHSIFEILEVRRDEGLVLKDLIGEGEYWVKERRGTHGAAQGGIVCCRIAPYGGHFIMLGVGTLSWPRDVGYLFRRGSRYLRTKAKERPLTAFDALRLLTGMESNEEESLEDAKDALKRKLDRLGLKVDFRTLAKRINESKNPQEAFPEIFEFDFLSMRDFQETMDLLQDLWNKFPRREFGGLAPSAKFQPGPKESMLFQTLLAESQRSIDPDKYPTANDAQKAVNEFSDKWLKTPQEELGQRTPMDVILEERAALGDPRKEFGMQIQISRIHDYDVNKAKKLYRDGLEACKSGAWFKAMEFFEEVTEMYPEHYKAWGNLGSCHANLGSKRDAIKCYKKALSIEPNYEVAKRNLAAIKDAKEEDLAMLGLARTIKGLQRSMSARRSGRKYKRAENNE
ncbi:MAG: SEC-C metal-binding domain-containing protein [Candidatus Hadarchaeota archaeon]